MIVDTYEKYTEVCNALAECETFVLPVPLNNTVHIKITSLCVLFVTLVNIANIDYLDPIRKRGEKRGH